MLALRSLSARERRALVMLATAIGLSVAFVYGALTNPAMADIVSEWSGPFWISLRLAFAATAVAAVTGITAGYLLAKGRFRGRDTIEALLSLPILLPPTVLGFYLLQVLGEGNAIGGVLTSIVGQPLTNNFVGIVIAASIAAFPFCMRASRAAIEDVDPRLEQAARAMGLPNWRVALQVTLPLARRGIGAGVTLGCVRALGEYGAVLMVGGAIPGKTETMPIAVVDAWSEAERQTYAVILLTLAISAMILLASLNKPESERARQ